MEYLAAKRLLAQFEQLEKSPAYAEIKAQMQAGFDNCIAGLRNRKLTVEQRQEYIEGADLAEGLLKFVEKRVAGLRKDTTLTQAEMVALGLDREN